MKRQKSKINLLDILIGLVVLSILSLLFFRDAFVVIGGLTGVLSLMYLVIVWDDIVVWWSTRR